MAFAAVGPEQSTLPLVAMSRFPSLFVVILSAIIIGSTSQANAVPVEDFNDYVRIRGLFRFESLY